jgi:hypothetical protein
VRENMEIIIIGAIAAGAVAASVLPLQGVLPGVLPKLI